MNFLYNNSQTRLRRRQLRRTQTNAEKAIWSHLRRQSLEGLKFFRQYSIGPHIIDFYCPKIRLGIEIDGGQHAEKKNELRDRKRTEFLSKQNIQIIRFWNNEVLKQKEAVVEKIRHYIIALRK